MSKIRMKTRSELPAAVYAAAGAGDLAYEQLRRLPEVTVRTLRTASQTAESLRQRLGNGDRDLTADLTKVRSQVEESARRRAEAFSARAASAQERAVTSYRSLVARGEQVMSERFGVTTGHAESPTKVEVIVGDRDEAGPAGSVTAGPGGAAARPASSGNASVSGSRSTAGAGTAGTSASGTSAGSTTSGTSAGGGAAGPNARGVAKNGSKAAAKRPAA